MVSLTQIEENITQLCKLLPLQEESLEQIFKLCSRDGYSPDNEWAGFSEETEILIPSVPLVSALGLL